MNKVFYFIFLFILGLVNGCSGSPFGDRESSRKEIEMFGRLLLPSSTKGLKSHYFPSDGGFDVIITRFEISKSEESPFVNSLNLDRNKKYFQCEPDKFDYDSGNPATLWFRPSEADKTNCMIGELIYKIPDGTYKDRTMTLRTLIFSYRPSKSTVYMTISIHDPNNPAR